jgi:hypothetical protein
MIKSNDRNIRNIDDSLLHWQLQCAQNEPLKRTIQARVKKLKRWVNDDESYEQQKCWFKCDYDQRWDVAEKQHSEVEKLTWWQEEN